MRRIQRCAVCHKLYKPIVKSYCPHCGVVVQGRYVSKGNKPRMSLAKLLFITGMENEK